MSFNIYLKSQKAVPDTNRLLVCKTLENIMKSDNKSYKTYLGKSFSPSDSEIYVMQYIGKLKKIAEDELIGNKYKEL